MESSNQETDNGKKPKTINLRKRNNKEDNRQNQHQKINRKIQRGKTAKETVKSQKHKETHEKKRCHYLVYTIPLLYSFLQLLDLQKKRR